MLFHLLFAPHLLPLLQESGPQTRVWLAGRTENQGQCSLSLFLKQPMPRLPHCWACHKWQRHAGRWKGSGCYFGQQLAAKQPSCKVKPHLAANRRQEAIGGALLTRTCCVPSDQKVGAGSVVVRVGELRSRGMCPEQCRRAEGVILPLCSALQQPQLLCERPAPGVGL